MIAVRSTCRSQVVSDELIETTSAFGRASMSSWPAADGGTAVRSCRNRSSRLTAGTSYKMPSMIESYVDLTYRGLSLGKRVKLTEVRSNSAFV